MGRLWPVSEADCWCFWPLLAKGLFLGGNMFSARLVRVPTGQGKANILVPVPGG